MFNGKNKIAIVCLLVLVLCVSAVCMCACDASNTQEGEKSVVLIVGTQEISVKTDALYLHDLLVELNDAGRITYEFSTSEYGAVVSKLNDLETTLDWSKWIGVYHNIDDITLYTPGYDITINGNTYFSSSCGVSALVVLDGATYVFVQN